MEFNATTPATEIPQETRAELLDLVSMDGIDEFKVALDANKHYTDSATYYGTLIQRILRNNYHIWSDLILPKIQALLDAGADPNVNTDDYLDEKDYDRWDLVQEKLAPIHLACIFIRDVDYMLDYPNMKYNIIKLLLDYGADPNIRTARKKTPLHHIPDYLEHTDIIQLLIDRGADIDARDGYGWTPLYCTIQKHYLYKTRNMLVTTVRHLLNCGANMNIRSKVWCKMGIEPTKELENGPTALYEAVMQGNLEVVQVLLEYGAVLDDYVLREGIDTLMQHADPTYSEIIGLLKDYQLRQEEMRTWFKRYVPEEAEDSGEDSEEAEDATEDDDWDDTISADTPPDSNAVNTISVVSNTTEQENPSDISSEVFPHLEEEYSTWQQNRDWFKRDFREWIKDQEQYNRETEREQWEAAEDWLDDKYCYGYDCEI